MRLLEVFGATFSASGIVAFIAYRLGRHDEREAIRVALDDALRPEVPR